MDEQSRYGKAPLSVAERARDAGIPVVALAGRITLPPHVLAEYGVVAAVSLLDLVADPQDAMTQAGRWLTRATVHALEGA
ncbi:glycerate kinase [Arthrobacter sp. ATA002]|nr:glycerate kinase [Arthrobacter sp. ATA002]